MGHEHLGLDGPLQLLRSRGVDDTRAPRMRHLHHQNRWGCGGRHSPCATPPDVRLAGQRRPRVDVGIGARALPRERHAEWIPLLRGFALFSVLISSSLLACNRSRAFDACSPVSWNTLMRVQPGDVRYCTIHPCLFRVLVSLPVSIWLLSWKVCIEWIYRASERNITLAAEARSVSRRFRASNDLGVRLFER